MLQLKFVTARWATEANAGNKLEHNAGRHCHQLACAAWRVYWLAAHLQPAQLQAAPVQLQPQAGLSWGQPPGPGQVQQGLSHQARQQTPVQM